MCFWGSRFIPNKTKSSSKVDPKMDYGTPWWAEGSQKKANLDPRAPKWIQNTFKFESTNV